MDSRRRSWQYIKDLINYEPAVVLVLEWREFCWSLRKLFDAVGVSYKSVDIDSVEYQDDSRGVKTRTALGKRVGSLMVPQLFIAGE